jgi:hypothetical protein
MIMRPFQRNVRVDVVDHLVKSSGEMWQYGVVTSATRSIEIYIDELFLATSTSLIVVDLISESVEDIGHEKYVASFPT